MTRYAQHVARTAQTTKVRADQVQNSAGGYVFALDKWQRLDRFLILGTDSGTYYATEQALTVDNAGSVSACIAENGPQVVRRIVEISEAGRAPKNDPAIFALAMCTASPDEATRKAAYLAIPLVCRIGTHLFHFVADVNKMRGWSRGLRSAVARWYSDRRIDPLALQLAKYQQRDKWAQRDVLRLAHPKPPSANHHAALRWSVEGLAGLETPPAKRGKAAKPSDLPSIIVGMEAIHAGGVSPQTAARLIRDYNLPHECVPNELKGDPRVWEAILEDMPPHAMIRNLAKMTAVGLLKPMSPASRVVIDRLASTAVLKKARVHPMAILLALGTYRLGHGIKGNLMWSPVPQILDALNDAFYGTFSNVAPTGKRRLIALDISGSMTSPLMGSNLSCREGSSAMAMITAATEAAGSWHVLAFTGNRTLSPLELTPKTRLDRICAVTERLPFDRTDCAIPMLYAAGEKLEVDAFEIYTDNETWSGSVHPFQALREYRGRSGIPAKMVVVGMTSTGFTIADPSDAGCLDVVGFDSDAPALMANFIADRLGSDLTNASVAD